MPALAADIGAAIRDVQLVSWTSATIALRYPSARDGSLEPADGYFDDPAAAQAVMDARGALIGTERRRFTVLVQDVLWIDPSLALPTVTLIDPEQATNGLFMISRIELDLDSETTSLELFG